MSHQLAKKTFLIILGFLLFTSSLGMFNLPVSEAAPDGPKISTVKSGGFQGITVDSSGNLYYVKSTDATKIYKLTTAGVESAFASLASTTYQLVIDANDNIYAAAASGLKKVDPSGVVTTVAGPTNMSSNMALAIDSYGNLFYSNGSLNSLYKVNPQGNVTTVATGFTQIMGMAVNSDGTIYVSEYTTHEIKKIDTNGNVTVVAGTSGTSGYSGNGGQASSAKLKGPHNLIISDGQLYITEFDNFVLRKIDLASGIISTVAGTGVTGNSGDGGAANAAKLGNVWSISEDAFGVLYIATTDGLRSVFVPGTLDGTVQDGNNNPVSGATVTMVGGFTSTSATTDASGNFTFNNAFPGSKKLTVTASGFADGTATASVMSGMSHSTGTIKIGAHVTGVALDQSALSLSAGGSTAALSAVVAPSNAGNKSVTWSSSNSNVAAVDNNGLVTPVAAGTATITATTDEGGFIASSTVTVSRTLSAPTGLTSTADDGQVTLNWSAVPVSGVVTYNVYKATVSGAYGSVADATVSGVTYSYTATGLTNGTTYYFVVKAKYDEGISGNSNETSATPVTINTPVSSNAALSSLTLSSGTLVPVFDKAQTAYTATVAYGISSATVTASVYEPGSSVKVNGVATTSGVASAELPLSLGANTITVEVTAQDDITQKTYTILVTRLSGNQSSSSGGTSTSSSNGTQVVIDGVVQEQLATGKKDNIGGQTATIITIDNDKVIAKLEKDGNKVFTIPVAGNSDVVVSELNGKLVKAMEGKDVVIEIKTDLGSYTLPATLININSISAQLGSNVKLEDIKISIKIGLSLPTTTAAIQKSAADGAMLLVGSPMDFEVTAILDGKTVVVNQFQSYVERNIALPTGSDASQVTTAVVLNTDGSLTHVPTKLVTTDGKTNAIINSLTNSSYALVLSPKTFADVENHWSKQDVNDMASRQIVQGVTNEAFQPDKAVTRAEFVAIMVRALGLKPGLGTDAPKDIQVSDWYAGVVQTGVSYKLISGYEDGTFRPNLTITRTEASTIVARALTIAKLNQGMNDVEVTKQLELFADGFKVPAWAKNDLAIAVKNSILQGDNGKIMPDDNVTRAQTAAMLRRLLQQANLIN
ncbi:S-layer homology domain-containing protein [Paenibacillus sp. FSL H8-0034]|uniref:S-layer homology domain-containing protein n=1 Tax=Paenibacillus sp. FSL H8-0034 TaxID=2954671 RepID=UPI0030F572F3